MNRKQLLLGSILAGLSISAQAGVVIQYVTRNTVTGKEDATRTMWVQNGSARIESTEAKQTTTMLFKDEAFHVLEATTKTYRVMDKAYIAQTAGTMNDAMAKMRAQMEKMPPDQRAMMEQMMKQRGGAMMGAAPSKPVVYDAQPTGGSETINGKSCKLWNVSRDGVLSQQLCVVPLNAMPGANEVIELSKKMSAVFEGFNDALRAQMDGDLQQSSATLAKINGYPIMTRGYRDGVLQPEQLIVKTWQQQSIDAAKFAIPADYKKQEMPKMPGR